MYRKVKWISSEKIGQWKDYKITKKKTFWQLITIARGNDDNDGNRAAKRRNMNWTKVMMCMTTQHGLPNRSNSKANCFIYFRIFHHYLNNFVCLSTIFLLLFFIRFFFVNVSFAGKITISWREREKNKFSFRFSFVLTKCCRFHFSKHNFAKTMLAFQSHSCVEWHV